MKPSLRAEAGCHAEHKRSLRPQVRSICLVFTTYSLIFLFACGSAEQKPVVIPPDVLSKEKMAEVITDIHLAEAEANLKTLPDSTSTAKLSFQKIFDKNKITKAQYDTSLSFYINNPQMLDSVYEKVLNELSKMQGGSK